VSIGTRWKQALGQ